MIKENFNIATIFKSLKGDRAIWLIALILSLWSVVAVYSASGLLAFKYRDGDTEYFLIKHGIMILSGFGLMYAAHLLKFKYYSRIAQIAVWLAVILLMLTFMLGVNINDASRWLRIPIINQNFQTSDFAKLALIIYLARTLSLKKEKLKSFKEGVVPIFLPVIVICGLILPANFSTAALLFLTSLIIMYIGRVQMKHIASVLGIGIVGFLLLLSLAKSFPGILPRIDTWAQRLETFFNAEEQSSDDSYQTLEAEMAIANGGLLGKLPGGATSRNSLPEAWSDMIYAFIIEEYGSLIGGVGIILLYLIFFYRALRIATKCENDFGMLLVIGISFLIVFQAFINMAVSTGLFPVTGQTLPLISMGGTSTWFTCLAIGIVLSVSRTVYKEEEHTKPKNSTSTTGKEEGYAVA